MSIFIGNYFFLFLKSNVNDAIKVHEIFCEWKPFDKYDLGQLRGSFLEELTLELLKDVYDDELIFQESKIILGDFQSHFWDVIVIVDDWVDAYECKFSSYSVNRGQLDDMVGLRNNLESSMIFLVVFQPKGAVIEILNTLKGNTSAEVYEKYLDKINIISLEDFSRGNPFRDCT